MNKDEILRMAEEAGFVIDEKARQYQPNCIFHTYHMVDELLVRFAALIALAEREACIDLVAMYGGPVDLEAAIRARSQHEQA